MPEIVVNLHMHTCYSDGTGTHRDIARAALRTGLDAVIVTDHNVLVQGFEGYYQEKNRRLLLLVGEEIHDQDRDPQKNHLLAFGAESELASFADDPQLLINRVRNAGGLSFIAHLYDPAAPLFNEDDLSWVDWSVENYTGIELWNALSELKTHLPTMLHGILYAYLPALVAHAPSRFSLERWDKLLSEGRRVVAIGGSDAHALQVSLGPLHRSVFSYDFHFRTINTHVILPTPLTGEVKADKRMLYEALAQGRCFIGYDLPAPTRGFRFTAQGRVQSVIMGEEITAHGGVTLQAHLPSAAEMRLVKDGRVIQTWKHQQAIAHITTHPGVYRLEVYRRYLGKKRGWIFSNPIYVT